MPAAKPTALTEDGWTLGQPDLVVKSPEVSVPAVAPDKWGSIGLVPTGVTEDRWVKSVEVREVNNIPRNEGTKTVGGRFVFHHMTYQSVVAGQRENTTSWPIHEVGRNADIFPDNAGKLLRAGSVLNLFSTHLHSNGRDTKSRLLYGFNAVFSCIMLLSVLLLLNVLTYFPFKPFTWFAKASDWTSSAKNGRTNTARQNQM
jgi:hypothetical protein